MGALIFPTGGDCYEGSHFAAYKNAREGVTGYFSASQMIYSDMVMIDNAMGIAANLGGGKTIRLQRLKIYGESPIPDCPDNGGYCFKISKYGVLSSNVGGGAKDLFPEYKKRPIALSNKDGAWGSIIQYEDVEFHDWRYKTRYGQAQHAIKVNPGISDFIPMHEATDTKFYNVDEDAIIKFSDPLGSWANMADCGTFPCTGPNNVLFVFRRNKFYLDTPFRIPQQFELIPDVRGYTEYFEDCRTKPAWKGHLCQSARLSILLFESQDSDNMDRSVQPVYVKTNSSTGKLIQTKLNSYMDHSWDGFYTSQKRMSRFPALIDARRESVHEIEFTGTPPKDMRFALFSGSIYAGTTIRIYYPSAMSRKIYKGGQLIEMNQWQEWADPPMYGPIQQKFCGENRYIGVKNILEFYITQGCELKVTPRNAIQTMVRMEWTLEAFFAKGGTTTFMDRLAGALGIHASSIKVVSLFRGSVVINYEMEPVNGKSLADLKKLQVEAFSNPALNLGAPLLDVTITSGSDGLGESTANIISDGVFIAEGYESRVITKTAGNQAPESSKKGAGSTDSYIPSMEFINFDKFEK